ncbi:MAG: DUF1844 domain-containing protein [Candidatus Binataceae bacterium]
MTEEEVKQKGFKVDDRRRFSAEGEPRPEFQGAADAQDTTASGANRSATGTPGAPTAGAALQSPGAAELDINFSTFVVSLSTQALSLLGEIPDPVSGERRRDLSAAQQIIDIIGMLRDKTRGNLGHDEEHLVDAILFDLRMKYVEIARQPAGR